MIQFIIQSNGINWTWNDSLMIKKHLKTNLQITIVFFEEKVKMYLDKIIKVN